MCKYEKRGRTLAQNKNEDRTRSVYFSLLIISAILGTITYFGIVIDTGKILLAIIAAVVVTFMFGFLTWILTVILKIEGKIK
jgi:hypothetical protein